MKVYFIRHGDSTLTDRKHQFPESPLSDRGIKQAEAVAKRFSTIPIDLIISSSYIRALQTAKAIEKLKSVPLIESELLIERKMPSQFYGKDVNDPEILPIHTVIREKFFDPAWHHGDEENFTDLLTRTKSAVELIVSQQKENIVVVTHGYFLTVLIYYLLIGEIGNTQTFKSFREHTMNSNTGVTLCDYTDGTWKLMTWNDYAHLGN
jgi:broad specificity phosphatase PhoE